MQRREAGKFTPTLAAPIGASEPAESDVLLRVLRDAVSVLEGAGLDYLLIGGLAIVIHGRPRHSRDIDFLVRPEDAQRALDALEAAGFETNPINPNWIFKAFREQIQIDLIFKLQKSIYLDEEMLRRCTRETFHACKMPVIPPEDLLVIKALAHDEDTPRHWHDALSIITRAELDWDYVLARSVAGPHRVLSLLHYATSIDLLVPVSALRRLSAMVFQSYEADATER